MAELNIAISTVLIWTILGSNVCGSPIYENKNEYMRKNISSNLQEYSDDQKFKDAMTTSTLYNEHIFHSTTVRLISTSRRDEESIRPTTAPLISTSGQDEQTTSPTIVRLLSPSSQGGESIRPTTTPLISTSRQDGESIRPTTTPLISTSRQDGESIRPTTTPLISTSRQDGESIRPTTAPLISPSSQDEESIRPTTTPLISTSGHDEQTFRPTTVRLLSPSSQDEESIRPTTTPLISPSSQDEESICPTTTPLISTSRQDGESIRPTTTPLISTSRQDGESIRPTTTPLISTSRQDGESIRPTTAPLISPSSQDEESIRPTTTPLISTSGHDEQTFRPTTVRLLSPSSQDEESIRPTTTPLISPSSQDEESIRPTTTLLISPSSQDEESIRPTTTPLISPSSQDEESIRPTTAPLISTSSQDGEIIRPTTTLLISTSSQGEQSIRTITTQLISTSSQNEQNFHSTAIRLISTQSQDEESIRPTTTSLISTSSQIEQSFRPTTVRLLSPSNQDEESIRPTIISTSSENEQNISLTTEIVSGSPSNLVPTPARGSSGQSEGFTSGDVTVSPRQAPHVNVTTNGPNVSTAEERNSTLHTVTTANASGGHGVTEIPPVLTHDLPALPYREQLDYSGDYVLHWGYDEDNVTFEVHVSTTGYVGFGISRYGGMYPADVIIGGVLHGNAYFADFYTEDNAMPIMDKKQDWYLLFASENSTKSVLRFTRALNTCDEHDRQIDKEYVNIIYAFGKEDAADWNSLPYHGAHTRGHKRISLLEPGRKMVLPADVKTHDIGNDRVEVPTMSTSYNCRIVKPPPTDSPHHVIAFEPMIEEGNERHVHHIMLYGCEGLDLFYDGYMFDCVDERVITGFCTNTYAVLTKGTGSYELPGHVGFSIGKPSDPQLFMIQIHYNNPDMKEGVLDSSGVRIYYTPTLRENEAGVLLTGMMSNPRNIIIPPNYKNFLYMGHCHPDCLEKGIPDGHDSINVVAVTHHTHLLGRRAVTRHIRNGTELPPLAVEARLNFEYQGKLFVEKVTVKKGDVIRVECEFDSTGRTSNTHGGYSTKDEMCLAQIIYYPKMTLDQCYSMPMYSNLDDSTVDVVSQIESWNYTDPAVRDRYQNLASDSRHRFICEGIEYETIWGYSDGPAIRERYVSSASNCSISI
ncbi:hypothetical protein ScPMuIL_010142 [Solemya velum]